MFTVACITIFLITFLGIIISRTTVFGWFCLKIVRCAKQYRCKQRPKRIILIRHGESQGNQDSKIYSTVADHAIGLTDKGREQAHRCGEELKKLIGIDDKLVCFVSPFLRSKETCELICQAFPQEKVLKVREDPRIREQEWGNFQDLATRDNTVAERQKIGRFFYRFKDGESGADVYDRVSSFMDSLHREMDNTLMPYKNIFIVSHGLFMRLFLMRFFRWPVERFHTLENFDNCGYCVLEKDEKNGSFSLKTELTTYPKTKPTNMKKLRESFSERSFDEEVHPSMHSKDIRHNGRKNE